LIVNVPTQDVTLQFVFEASFREITGIRVLFDKGVSEEYAVA
jgi:hypothetical protein